MGKKEIIMEVAVKLFALQGFASTSTSEIAKEAGVAEGTIFHHYKSKRRLFLSIIEDTFQKFSDSFTNVLDNTKKPEENLRSVINNIFINIRTYPNRFRLLHREFPNKSTKEISEFSLLIKEKTEALENSLLKIVRSGVDSGDFHAEHPERIAFIIRSMLFGVVKLHFVLDKDITDIEDQIAEFCLKSLKGCNG